MKHLALLFFVVLYSVCDAQTTQDGSLLINQKQISDFSSMPIYERITEQSDGKATYKEPFLYIDSIEVYVITYLSDGLKINGLLVKPKAAGNYPCVIFNRGGNQNFGSLTVGHALLTMGQLAKEGYVVIASQYRGNARSEGKEEFGGSDVNDVTILPSVLNEVEGADTTRIGMYGWSRGGMMTYLALARMDQIKAAAVGGALTDLSATIADRPEMETVLDELVPNYQQESQAALYQRSAIKWVDQLPATTPILLLHGGSDWRVKPEQSLRMALELDKYRIPYRLMIFEGGDHGISEHKKEVNTAVIDWFNRFLKNNEPLPETTFHGE